jgi:hypothetical protein
MNEKSNTHPLTTEDGKLLDLVRSALVDPNLHTDLRMRLHSEITELLKSTHEHMHGPGGREAHERSPVELPNLLEEVLVDPNLRTDLRMRLHNEIPQLLRAAHQRAKAPAEQSD